MNILIVLTHEIAHALGLNHSKNKASLLYAFYTGGGKVAAPLYIDNLDRAALQYLYGRNFVVKINGSSVN